MIGFIVAVFWFALVLLAIGTVLAFLTSWRDGCLGKDVAQIKSGLTWVFLTIKNFAQLFFNRTAYRHARSYWMYYALLVLFMILITQSNI